MATVKMLPPLENCFAGGHGWETLTAKEGRRLRYPLCPGNAAWDPVTSRREHVPGPNNHLRAVPTMTTGAMKAVASGLNKLTENDTTRRSTTRQAHSTGRLWRVSLSWCTAESGFMRFLKGITCGHGGAPRATPKVLWREQTESQSSTPCI